MKNYLNYNKNYWKQGVFDAPNPETYVFRAYGRIFKFQLGLDGSGKQKLLDFGCEQVEIQNFTIKKVSKFMV